LIAFGLMLLSFLFLYAGKVESTIFDKNKNRFTLAKTTVICKSEAKNYILGDITNVKGVKKGHSGVNVYTLHYKVIVEFKNIPPVKILETQNGAKVRRQICLIKNFLGWYCEEEDVEIIDESTRI